MLPAEKRGREWSTHGGIQLSLLPWMLRQNGPTKGSEYEEGAGSLIRTGRQLLLVGVHCQTLECRLPVLGKS